jgi:hypothetical protein
MVCIPVVTLSFLQGIERGSGCQTHNTLKFPGGIQSLSNLLVFGTRGCPGARGNLLLVCTSEDSGLDDTLRCRPNERDDKLSVGRVYNPDVSSQCRRGYAASSNYTLEQWPKIPRKLRILK